MEYMTLGRSDVKVSKIGLGVWQASKDWNGDDKDVIGAIRRAHELGVNFFDTAEGYGGGHSEEVLGRAAKAIGREELVIATKVYGPHLRYDELHRACKASATRLGIKEIDVYQVHWPDPWEQIPLKQTMKSLEKLYTDGKIRAIAVSNFAVRDLEEARSCLSKTDIVSNQLRYNLLQREIEEEVLPYCKREKISVLAWSPIAQGALTGKYSRDIVPKGDVRESNPIFAPKNLAQIQGFNSLLSKIATKRGKTITQIALSWLVSNPAVIPIPGAKNAAQAEENAGAAEVHLTPSELEEISKNAGEVKLDYFV